MPAQAYILLERALTPSAPDIKAVRADAWARLSSFHRHAEPLFWGADQVDDDRVNAQQALQRAQQETIRQRAEGETIMGSDVGASACQETGSRGDAESAGPHGLVTLRMDGILQCLTKARAHMLRGELAAKSEAISRCVAIIGGLRDSLDPKVEPTLVGRLDSLYEYMSGRLLQANLRDDASIIDEVSKLLHQVRDSWVQIAPAPVSHAVGA